MEEIERISLKLDQIQAENRQILFYLHNDDKTNKKGLVQKVEDLAAEILTIKNKMMVSAAKKSLWMLIIGAAGASILWLVEKAFVLLTTKFL